LALLGILREAGTGARRVLPSTIGIELSDKQKLAPRALHYKK